MIGREINECVVALLSELVRFQDRLHARDPVKARQRRRLVCGLKEVTKHLKLKRLKLVIMSPDVERIESKGEQNTVSSQQVCSSSKICSNPIVFNEMTPPHFPQVVWMMLFDLFWRCLKSCRSPMCSRCRVGCSVKS